MLYTGASYPLLYGRMGEGEKEWGKKKNKKGEGVEGRKDLREVVGFFLFVFF